MGLPSMTSLLRSKSSLKSSQKSVVVKVKQRRADDEEPPGQEDSCELMQETGTDDRRQNWNNLTRMSFLKLKENDIMHWYF